MADDTTLPAPSSLNSPLEVLAVRMSLPRVRAGDPLQSYKWALSMRLRALRVKAAGHLPDATVRHLISDAGNRCPLCGNDMRFWVSRRWPTVDHVVALANGGTHDLRNLRVICNRCNSRKADHA